MGTGYFSDGFVNRPRFQGPQPPPRPPCVTCPDLVEASQPMGCRRSRPCSCAPRLGLSIDPVYEKE